VTADRTLVRFADVDGDGRFDYPSTKADGDIHAHLNCGGDAGGGWADAGIVVPAAVAAR
jgi:hypothetical protein